MNENLDLTKILDGCPEGTKFYSSNYGNVQFIDINLASPYPIRLMAKNADNDITDVSVTKRGTHHSHFDGECTLFPSKTQRDWSKFERFWDEPKVEKFDPKTLKPFDKILVRKMHSLYNSSRWSCEYFSYINPNTPNIVNGISAWYEVCIPYNEETKHLLGTSDDCSEYYKWWEK